MLHWLLPRRCAAFWRSAACTAFIYETGARLTLQVSHEQTLTPNFEPYMRLLVEVSAGGDIMPGGVTGGAPNAEHCVRMLERGALQQLWPLEVLRIGDFVTAQLAEINALQERLMLPTPSLN